jgi:outer membrane protein assembly factor BamB
MPRNPLNKSLKFLALAVLGIATGCAKPPVRYTPNPIAALPAGSLALAWIAPLNVKNDAVNRIDVRDDVIYVFTEGKQVFAINRKPGTIRFATRVKTSSPRLLPPVELADKLVFPTATSLELFNKKGEHLRSVPLDKPLHSGATGAGQTVYFGAFDPYGGRLLAVNLQREYSTTEWELLTQGSISASPIIYSSIIYAGTEKGEVYAVSEERKPVWNIEGSMFHAGGAITADLKADDAGLYISSKDSELYCLNRLTGKVQWQYFAGAPLATSAVPTLDTVYQYVPGQGLAAIDKKSAAYNRTPKWIVKDAVQFLAQDDSYVYLMEPRRDAKDEQIIHHAIVAVDKQTGQKAFEARHTDFSVFGTNTKDDIVYAGYATGQILALRPVLKAGQIGELVLAPVAGESVALAK